MGMEVLAKQFQVQRAGLAGDNWKTICRGEEMKAREVFEKQLMLSSVGRFRLIDPDGKVLIERKAQMLFSN